MTDKQIIIDDVAVSYFYNGILKGNIKLISIQRLHRFMDKYRGLQIRGYNIPVMCFKTFNTKTCKETFYKWLEHKGLE